MVARQPTKECAAWWAGVGTVGQQCCSSSTQVCLYRKSVVPALIKYALIFKQCKCVSSLKGHSMSYELSLSSLQVKCTCTHVHIYVYT